jgi:alcohol dehydrogenase
MSFISPTKIYLGIHSHKKLEEILENMGIRRLFFLSDNGVASTEIYSLVQRQLENANVKYDFFNDIEPDPSVKTVEKAYSAYQNNRAPALLALGGGSPIDVAKAVGILATNGGKIQSYEGIDKFKNPPLPLIAIPTTAGTGSEVSGSCVVTDTDRGLKLSIRSAALNPATVAILDPLATKSLPTAVATHAAMDAFVHALESYVARTANPITDAVNLNAIELIAGNVRRFISDKNDLDAGLKMLCAASLAAMGFSNTGAGNIHCMARFVGAFFHVSHGLSNAVCLPYGAAFNLTAAQDKFARVALAMGENINGLTTVAAGSKAVEAIKKMCKDLGIPETLREVGVTKDKIPQMARLAFEADYNRWNPRHTTEEDFRSLFEKAF